MKRKNTNNEHGFSLIELLLYISISATVLLAVASLLSLILKGEIKNQAITEVEQQGSLIMKRITYNIRNAEAVTSPGAGGTSDSLTLQMPNADRDPVTFDSQDRTIRITEDGNSPIPLSNSKILVSGLSFTNLSSADPPSSIRINFTLDHINPEGRQEYEYSRTFIGTATVR